MLLKTLNRKRRTQIRLHDDLFSQFIYELQEEKEKDQFFTNIYKVIFIDASAFFSLNEYNIE